MRIVFMGTPAFAAHALDRLAADGVEIAAVYTRAPTPAGRGMALRKSPVHERADALGVAVFTPRSLRGQEAAAHFASHAADVGIVVAYGLILPPAILAAPRHGCLNLHASLLPRWRGAAPIQRAIMAGDDETGVMAMRMEAGLDTGPVALTTRLPIGPDMNAGDLHDALAPLGADLLARALGALAKGGLTFTPQAEAGVTYARKIEKSEGRIDWFTPAARVHNQVRGLSPFPGAYFEADFGRGPERLKVLRAAAIAMNGAPGAVLDHAGAIACADGALRLIEVQRAGRAPMAAGEFLRGARFAPGLVVA